MVKKVLMIHCQVQHVGSISIPGMKAIKELQATRLFAEMEKCKIKFLII